MSAGAPPLVLIAHPSPDVYGSDLQMLESAVALRDHGYRVLVALPYGGPLVARLQELGVEVVLLDFPVLRRSQLSPVALVRMGLAAAVAVGRLWSLVRRRRVALVYVNTITVPWWLLAARLAGVPALCHLHEAENADSVLVRRLLFGPLLLARAVIVISEAALSSMRSAGPRLADRAQLIYNGVPAPAAAPLPARRGRPFRAVVVGRLSPRKAPHVALEAVGALREAGLEVELDVVGTEFPGYEWYAESLRVRAERSDLRGAVRFRGYRAPIWPELAEADVVLAPSLREPFGNAVVEAQLSLRPVVATASMGHLESVEHERTGLLVPADDADALAAAVRRVMEDDRLAEALAVRGGQEAVRRFSTERYAREVADLVDRLLSAGHERITKP